MHTSERERETEIDWCSFVAIFQSTALSGCGGFRAPLQPGALGPSRRRRDRLSL